MDPATACSRLRRPVVLSQHPLDNRHLQVGESRTSKASGERRWSVGRSTVSVTRIIWDVNVVRLSFVSYTSLYPLLLLLVIPLLSFQFVQSPLPGGLADLLSSSSLGTSWLGRGTLFLHASSLRVLNPQSKFSQRPYCTFSVSTLPTHPTTCRTCCIQYISSVNTLFTCSNLLDALKEGASPTDAHP